MEVTRKRMGIIGMGRIGRTIAKRARGFDMTVHYFNRSRLHTRSRSRCYVSRLGQQLDARQ